MLTLYMLLTSIITLAGLLFVIKAFLLPYKNRKCGFLFFSILFMIHECFMMVVAEAVAVPIKCTEYLIFYVASYVILRYFFQGNAVKNFAWVYGANFIYQAIATVMALVIPGVWHNFDVYELEQAGNRPSVVNVVMLAVTAVLGCTIARALILMLQKRNNRMLQVIISILAAGGILAGAVNSAESFYIIVPILVTALVAGILYQDRLLQTAEKQEIYYRQLEERQKIRQEELTKIRHDLANHISVIDSSKSMEYAQEVLNCIDEKIKSGDTIIDCLLYEKALSCRKKGIGYKEQIMDLTQSRVNNFEWISLLANLLDNAMEACEKIAGDKSIELIIKRIRDYVVISMANSKCISEKPVENKFKTTKKQNMGHGCGTKIIKDIVDKHQGRIRYEDLGDKLITHITMQVW